jgi:aminoglycoside phosphotransferase (APT) family kinase protein
MIPRVNERLVIEDGPTVQLQDRRAQGTRHDVLFGVLSDTGEPVVVKLERIPGVLERERAALAWLGREHGPVPRVVAAGTVVLKGERVACLVTERCSGSQPTTTEGWWRMGRAHARLGDLQHPTSGLPILDPTTFGRQHAQRVSDLGNRLARLVGSIPDWKHLVSPELPVSAPLVITHGDPGPGNYLDDDDQGTLIDWEQAHIAPRGLDLARLVFIALLGAGPIGYVARDHRSRAEGAVKGYLSATSDGWQPTREESRWWTTVAGIQFVYHRWKLSGTPAPWEDALKVLQAALADDLVWSCG